MIWIAIVLIIWSVIVSYNNYSRIKDTTLAIEHLEKTLMDMFAPEEEVHVQKEALMLSNKFIRDFRKRMDPGLGEDER